MLIFGVLIIIVAMLVFLCSFFSDDDSIAAGTCVGCIITLMVECGISLITEERNPEIKPLDVYQGKTTLEYTIKNGVVTDSVVVWK